MILQVYIRNSPLLTHFAIGSPNWALLTRNVQWGLLAGSLGFVGLFLSPIYRGLTLQFKVYVLLNPSYQADPFLPYNDLHADTFNYPQ